jgi:hydrogenase expression/formation protein HypD
LKKRWGKTEMKQKVAGIKKKIARLADGMERITIMEVCGTHTASARKWGIRELLPGNIRLISGPGCPVCVTDQKDIASAIFIAEQDKVILTCFGDMMRVPCGDKSLYSLYESGRDVRIITSPLEALSIAQDNPDRQVVYFGIGFETTAPLTAALIEAADEGGVKNLSVFSAHKTMPRALTALLKRDSNIDALMCPGHVASIIGARAFSFVPDELMLPAAVAGFGAYDIMVALYSLILMLRKGEKRCVNVYPLAVTDDGNREALSLLYKVFESCDAQWRGLGEIRGSGLRIKDRFVGFDAASRFDPCTGNIEEAKGCICAGILCGKNIPTDCANFGRNCRPEQPLGACMVSSEGSCAAYYRYGGESNECKRE